MGNGGVWDSSDIGALIAFGMFCIGIVLVFASAFPILVVSGAILTIIAFIILIVDYGEWNSE